MSELDPTTNIIRSVSEAQIIEDFGKYEGITIKRIDDRTVRATFQEAFGEGSVSGDSVLNVLLNAVRRQKTNEYWRGYSKAEEEGKIGLEEAIQDSSERLEQLTASITLLRETTDTAIEHLASHVSYLALQFSIDHEQKGAQS
jgi:hypothetical protein